MLNGVSIEKRTIREVVKKNGLFYGQADRKGGGSAPSALTVRNVKILVKFFPILKW